jgi:hypothetical protein
MLGTPAPGVRGLDRPGRLWEALPERYRTTGEDKMLMLLAILCGAPAFANDGCVRDGVQYDNDGNVVGCEGGGNWCSGAPKVPGICDAADAKPTVPPAILGAWSYSVGACRGSSFTVHEDRIEYLAGLEPLGTGRIIAVSEGKQGQVLIRTILEGRGGFLRLWPTAEEDVFAFGFGVTEEASLEQHCTVKRLK